MARLVLRAVEADAASDNTPVVSFTDLYRFSFLIFALLLLFFCLGPQFFGTVLYASMTAHRGEAQSYRDDLEALIYVFAWMLNGGLPWGDCSDPDTVLTMKRMCVESLVAGECKKVVGKVSRQACRHRMRNAFRVQHGMEWGAWALALGCCGMCGRLQSVCSFVWMLRLEGFGVVSFAQKSCLGSDASCSLRWGFGVLRKTNSQGAV